MPNRRYEAGNRFERRVKDDLLTQGYEVWQSRGSKSAADLIALKPRQVVLVQVKTSGIFGHDAWMGLWELAGRCGAIPVLAQRVGRSIRYDRLLAPHKPRSRHWPMQGWEPDELAQAQAAIRQAGTTLRALRSMQKGDPS